MLTREVCDSIHAAYEALGQEIEQLSSLRSQLDTILQRYGLPLAQPDPDRSNGKPAPAEASSTSVSSTSTESPKQEVPPPEKRRRGPETIWKTQTKEERNEEIRRRAKAGESHRAIAKAQFCTKCSERIGYAAAFSMNGGKYEHMNCPKKAAS